MFGFLPSLSLVDQQTYLGQVLILLSRFYIRLRCFCQAFTSEAIVTSSVRLVTPYISLLQLNVCCTASTNHTYNHSTHHCIHIVGLCIRTALPHCFHICPLVSLSATSAAQSRCSAAVILRFHFRFFYNLVSYQSSEYKLSSPQSSRSWIYSA